MAVLLPILAMLQYHWLGQVSEGATERLRGSLQSSANAFRHDFNRELIRSLAEDDASLMGENFRSMEHSGSASA